MKTFLLYDIFLHGNHLVAMALKRKSLLCQKAVPFSNFQNGRKRSFVWGNGRERSHPNRLLQ